MTSALIRAFPPRAVACLLLACAAAAQASDGPQAGAAAPLTSPVAPAAAVAAEVPAMAPPAAAEAAPPAAAARPRLPPASPPTRQALETLLGVLPDTPEAASRDRVAARRGETLDALIRRAMPDSPFKEAFLRGALQELNPAAFQPGTTRLLPGAQLVLPTVADLRKHLQRVLGQPPAPPITEVAPSPTQERRQWVRYP